MTALTLRGTLTLSIRQSTTTYVRNRMSMERWPASNRCRPHRLAYCGSKVSAIECRAGRKAEVPSGSPLEEIIAVLYVVMATS